jgi:hypothetical protein
VGIEPTIVINGRCPQGVVQGQPVSKPGAQGCRSGQLVEVSLDGVCVPPGITQTSSDSRFIRTVPIIILRDSSVDFLQTARTC